MSGKATGNEVIGNAVAKVCAKLTPDEMAIMVRALAVYQTPVESKPKQSPRAWFDRFRKAILKAKLGKKFEVKDVEQLRYFLGIEVARGAEMIVLSQMKYVLDLLTETSMLECKPAVSPIDVKAKMSAETREQINRERYQRLVGRLIYLSHIHPDISFAVSVVSRYMYDPKKSHMDTVYHILRYLESAPRKDLIFRQIWHMNIEDYCDSDWASCLDDRESTSDYCVFVGGNLVS